MRRELRKQRQGRKRKTTALQLALLRALMKLRLDLALHQTPISLLSSVPILQGSLQIFKNPCAGLEKPHFLHSAPPHLCSLQSKAVIILNAVII